MKNLGTRSSILVGLCGAALMITSIGCGSSSTPGTDASGNGGTSAGGSSGGGGTGGQAAPALSYTFGSSVQGWSINVYHDTGTSTNIGWELSPDAGIDAAMPPERVPAWITGARLYPVADASAGLLRAFAPQPHRLPRSPPPAPRAALPREGSPPVRAETSPRPRAA